MVIRPWGYAIWELMQAELNEAIKRSGAQNAYFPLFIPLEYFEAEAKHVDGFAKEMAIVTHHRLEEDPEESAGSSRLRPGGELAEPLIVRPTSETIIGKSFAKWIGSYRDLPLKVNQWANVVRWEMRPRVLLRTTEFLWQEGHTAHTSEGEAREEAEQMLEVYRRFAESFLAIPVLTGGKPEEERFPGAVMSLSIEAMMQDGKALQAGTSHYMGQSFAKAANIRFLDEDGQRKLAHTASWGVSTRLLGGLIMSHGDDVGLRLPPKVAPQQVVLVPVTRSADDAEVRAEIERLTTEIQQATYCGRAVRAMADFRDREAPAKRWEWIRKGVPIVIEIGPRDIAENVVTVRRRDTPDHSAETIERSGIADRVGQLLEEVQSAYLDEALDRLESRTATDIEDLEHFEEWFARDEGDYTAGGFVRAPWSEAPESAALMKDLGVSVRCLPFDQEPKPGGTCVLTGKPAKVEAVFAKAY